MERAPSRPEAMHGDCADLLASAIGGSELRSRLAEGAASLAYEVNQPLTAIALNAAASLHWLSGEMPNLDEVRRLISLMESDARRAGAIVSHIQSIVLLRAREHAPVDLNEIANRAIIFLQDELDRHRITVVLDLPPGLPAAAANAILLQQVFVELAWNAIRAMDEVEIARRILVIRTNITPTKLLRAEIEDSGPALESREIKVLLDGFLQPFARGKGFSLAVCHSIVAEYGGMIGAENKADGTGARFWFTLPMRNSLSSNVSW